MELDELLELIIAERMNWLCEHRDKQRFQKVNQKYDELEKLLKTLKPEVEKKNQDYLDALLECQARELNAAYSLGIQDGIWLMKKIWRQDERK